MAADGWSPDESGRTAPGDFDFYDRNSKWRAVDDEKVRDDGLVLQTVALSRN
jgi:hypothetical protein